MRWERAILNGSFWFVYCICTQKSTIVDHNFVIELDNFWYPTFFVKPTDHLAGYLYLIWLVVWNIWIIFPYIGNFIIPTDEVIFFRGVGIPPTRYDIIGFSHWKYSYLYIYISYYISYPHYIVPYPTRAGLFFLVLFGIHHILMWTKPWRTPEETT